MIRKLKKVENRHFYKTNLKKYKLSSKEILDYKFICNIIDSYNLNADSDMNDRIGREVLGPLLVGYSEWLKKLTDDLEADEILFLAREGKAFKIVYEILNNSIVRKSKKEVKGKYVYTSRVALLRASIPLIESYEEFYRLLSGLLDHVLTIEDLCKMLGIYSYTSYQKIEMKIAGSIKLHISSIEDYDKLYDAIKTVGKDMFELKLNNIREYFTELGISSGMRVVISDIGWSGTMQQLLQKIFPEIDFIGAYFAVNNFHTEEAFMSMNRKGYVCDSDKWDENGQEIRFTTLAIESLLNNSEGSTIDYEKKDGIIVPVFEYKETNKDMKDKIEKIIIGYKNFAWDYISNRNALLFDNGADSLYQKDVLSPNVALIGYRSFAVYPSLNTIRFFESFINTSELTDANIIAKHKLVYYLLHPRVFYDEFDVTNAKIIWLKSVFRLPIPYYNYLRFLTVRLKMKSNRQLFNENIGKKYI